MSDQRQTPSDAELWRRVLALEKVLDQVKVKEVPLPNIGASVYRTANQSINSGTNTAIQFDNEEYDTAGFHDNATNNTRLGINYSGKYLFTACVQFAAGAGGLRYIFFQRNGLTTIGNQRGLFLAQVSSAANPVALTSSVILPLSAGDYIELLAFQDSGGALNVTAQTYAPWFQAHKLP